MLFLPLGAQGGWEQGDLWSRKGSCRTPWSLFVAVMWCVVSVRGPLRVSCHPYAEMAWSTACMA